MRAYLSDGTSLTFAASRVTDENKQFSIIIDINGDKKPNKYGRDMFIYNYFIKSVQNPEFEGKFVPGGVSYSRDEILSDSNYSCHRNRQGSYCSGLIMKDGWRIADDYPW